MKNVRRYFSLGNTYFLTHVTYRRKPILTDNVNLLWSAINKYKELEAFNLIAWVILPDHWHLIIDPERNQLSSLMKRIKLSFAQSYLKMNGQHSGRTWHNRFWDHVIRDSEDMNRHLDYIHYNAVKHGIVRSPMDYAHSSFQSYVAKGLYAPDWCSAGVIDTESEFGE